MTVYTRRSRARWLLVLSPFWLLYGVFVLLWLTLVWSVRALVWFVGALYRACDRLRFPQGVDSVGDDVTG